jgi:cell wall-associated NlpC family hydrolase
LKDPEDPLFVPVFRDLMLTVGLALLVSAAPNAAQAQSGGNGETSIPALPPPASGATTTSTLELPLNTGPTAPKPQPAKRPASKSGTRTVDRFSNARLPGLPLPSRSATSRTNLRQAPQPAPKVLAQLGVVTVAVAQVRVSREPDARLLSQVAQGTHLAVVADMGDHWGVLMVNNTIGWVPKANLELINYQTEVSVPSDPEPAQPTVSESAAGQAAGLPSDLDPLRQSLLREAFTYLGIPYVWGGTSRNGLDCSAFVKNVFAKHGVRLPRVSADQAKVGIPVQGPDLRPGDRLYFDMKRVGRVTHTGIYIGNGYFIHSSTNRKGVGVDSIFKPGYYRALVGARRDFE